MVHEARVKVAVHGVQVLVVHERIEMTDDEGSVLIKVVPGAHRPVSFSLGART
jgi:hypothetical protein